MTDRDWSADGVDVDCGKCDEPMVDQDETVRIKGLYGYGRAHRACVPDDYVEPPAPASDELSIEDLLALEQAADLLNKAFPDGVRDMKNAPPPPPQRPWQGPEPYGRDRGLER